MTVRVHVPSDWTVTGELPVLTGGPSLHITSPDGRVELDVEWAGDAFVGGARIAENHFSIRAAEPMAIREWALGLLVLAQQPA
jgi:hypothetical protein